MSLRRRSPVAAQGAIAIDNRMAHHRTPSRHSHRSTTRCTFDRDVHEPVIAARATVAAKTMLSASAAPRANGFVAPSGLDDSITTTLARLAAGKRYDQS